MCMQNWGPDGPHPKQKTFFFFFFFRIIIKLDPKLSKLFILIKYHMFWLSYECFSILCIAFLLKSAISAITAVCNYLSALNQI